MERFQRSILPCKMIETPALEFFTMFSIHKINNPPGTVSIDPVSNYRWNLIIFYSTTVVVFTIRTVGRYIITISLLSLLLSLSLLL